MAYVGTGCHWSRCGFALPDFRPLSPAVDRGIRAVPDPPRGGGIYLPQSRAVERGIAAAAPHLNAQHPGPGTVWFRGRGVLLQIQSRQRPP